MKNFLLASVTLFGLVGTAAHGQTDLSNASLEQLMDVQVTSVSKKGQKLAKTPAAVFVISQEDIRRSGATNIPDVLRMAPGVDVAQIDSSRWAITIRGFNALYGNKVLVLIDGRSVYLDSIAGVFWDQQDVPLEDIDRIEVIRGPGGTVWGANAMNGVINIITKDSRQTHGGLISVGGGSQTASDSLVQYGGSIGPSGSYRAYGHYFDINNSVTPQGRPAADGWHASHGGFRSDWDLSSRDTLNVQGDVMETRGGENVNVEFPATLLQTTLNQPSRNGLGDILARWEHTDAHGSQTSLQIYYEYSHRFGELGNDDYHRTTDVQFEQHRAVGARHDVVWGVDYRFDNINLQGDPAYAAQFNPSHRLDNLAATFLQDEITITRSLSLTVGSKFEHNAYTGFEYEPSAQLAWTPTSRQTVWASAARAIRQPAMLDYSVQAPLAIVQVGGNKAGVVTLLGVHNLKAEELRDFEAGYRRQLNRSLSIDLTGFLSYYRNLETFQQQSPFANVASGVPYLVIPEVWEFNGSGRDYGAEASVNWESSSRVKIVSGYTFLNMAISPGRDLRTAQISGDSPRNQFQVRGYFNLRRNVSWDTSVALHFRFSHRSRIRARRYALDLARRRISRVQRWWTESCRKPSSRIHRRLRDQQHSDSSELLCKSGLAILAGRPLKPRPLPLLLPGNSQFGLARTNSYSYPRPLCR
jgi:iron complex outermembrane receptor protein